MNNVTARPLNLGILGCGRIANAHLKAISDVQDLARLLVVADADTSNAASLIKDIPGASIADSYDHMLSMPELDAVIICTPNQYHANHSIQALSAGKHVLVEKPMSENFNDAVRMGEAADNAGCTLVIGQSLRHTEPIRYVQNHRNDFGKLRAIEVSLCVHWDGPQATWWRDLRPDQGLILSLFAPHALDFVQLITTGDPVSVHCEAAQHQSKWRAEDEAMILLRYPGDCLASVHVSYNQSFVTDRKTLHFEKALLRIENGDQLWIDDEQILGNDMDTEGVHRMGKRDLGNMFATQLREFIAAVNGQPNFSVSHPEGIRLMSLLDRVRAAASEKSRT